MNQRITTLLLVTFIPCLAPQSASPKTSQGATRCELTQDDYAVYAGLVAGLGRPEDPEEAWQGKEILIVDVTAGPGDVKSHWGTWGFRSKSKAAPSRETVVDLGRKVRSSCVLKPGFGDTKSCKIITGAELGSVFKEGGWQNFYTKYPEAGGTWTFSRPGYNSARNEAVVAVSHWCGELCGTGHLYFLTNQNDQWKVQNRLMLWIS